MSRTIDERIVSMSFDNKQFEKNANQSLSTLGKLNSALDFSRSNNSLKEISKTASAFNLNGISDGIAKVQAQFSALEIAGITAISNIVNRAVNAGLSIAKSLTLDQPIAGFDKYTKKTSSVQTLMNSTGESVAKVNEYLSRLMWYADETSFGFTDMTSALSTMVASGGDIEKLIPMIMGMGNAVAYAGKGATEFSRVIYNLNQSYSLGYLSTMDWRSVQMAGAASKQLQEFLISAAESIGTIQKGTGSLSKFSSYLTDKKITSEAMEIAFKNFAEYNLAIEDAVNKGIYKNATEAMEHMSTDGFNSIAVSAFQAAQNYKSFSEAIDAAKDAASTSWMKIFDAIFGDYEQAKSLWTRVGDDLNTLFVGPLDGLVSKTQEWASLWKKAQSMTSDNKLLGFDQNSDILDYASQTEAVYSSLSSTVATFIDNIVSAWNKGSTEISAKQIFNAIEKFRDTLKSINEYIRSDSFSGFYKIFSGISSSLGTIAKIGKTIVTSFINPLIKSFKPVINEIAGIFGDIGDSLYYSSGIIDSMGIPSLSNLLRNIVSSLQPLIGLLADIFGFIHKITSALKDKVYTNWQKDINNSTESFSIFSIVLDSASKVIEKIRDAFVSLCSVLNAIGSVVKRILESLKGAFETLKNAIGDFLNNNGTDIGKIFGIGILARIGINLGTAIKNIAGSFKNLGSLFDSLKGMNVADLIKKLISSFTDLPEQLSKTFESIKNIIANFTKGAEDGIESFKRIAQSMLIMAGALLILSSIDSDKAVSAMKTTIAMLLEMVVFIKVIKLIDPNEGLNAATKAISSISKSLVLMSVALKLLSGIDETSIQNGVLALGTLLTLTTAAVGILALIQEHIGKSFKGKAIQQAANSMKSMATALVLMSVALKVLSTIDSDNMATAVIAMTITLSELVIAAKLLAKNKASIFTFSSSVALIGPALILVSVALKILSTMPLTKSLIAVGSIGILFGELVITAKLLDKNKAAMITFAASVSLISPGLIAVSDALKILSTMSLAEAAIAVGSLGVVLAEIARFGIIIGKISGINFAIVSASMLLMSTSLISVAAAMKIMSSMSLSNLGVALLSLTGALVVLGSLGSLLGIVSPLILAGSVALIAFAGALALLSKGMLSAIEAVIAWQAVSTVFSSSFLEMASSITAAVLEIIPGIVIGLAKAVVESAESLLLIFSKLIAIICNAIIINVPTIIATVLSVILSILQAIRNNIGEFIKVVGEIIVACLNAFGVEIPNIIKALLVMFVNIINGLADLIRSESGEVGAALGNLASALIEGLIKGIGSAVISFGKNIAQAGKDFLSFLTGGMTDEEATQSQTETGKVIVDNFTTGMESKREEVVEKGKTLSDDTIAALNNPDGAFISGQNVSSGYSTGILDKKADVDLAVSQLNTDIATGLGNTDDAKLSGNSMMEAFHGEISNEKEPINDTIADMMATLTGTMDASESAETSGINTMNGLLSGLTNSDKLASLYNAGYNAAGSYLSGYNARMDQHSPSREMMRQAKFTLLGLINGFNNNLSMVKKSGVKVGNTALEAMKEALSVSTDLDDSTLKPVITPVLDLSELQKQSSNISGLINTNPSIKSLSNILGQNGANSNTTNNISINIEFNVEKVGGSLTDADILRYSNQIADQVNIRLGELL